MAQVEQFVAYMKIGDSRQEYTTYEIRVLAADAAAWLAAIGYAAKEATDVGQMLLGVEQLTAGHPAERGVRSSFVDDTFTFPAPDDNVYNFDKISVGFRAGLDRYTVTIPSRDDAAYNVADDGVTVIISGAGASAATTQFVTKFNTSAAGKNGGAATVEKMYIAR